MSTQRTPPETPTQTLLKPIFSALESETVSDHVISDPDCGDQQKLTRRCKRRNDGSVLSEIKEMVADFSVSKKFKH